MGGGGGGGLKTNWAQKRFAMCRKLPVKWVAIASIILSATCTHCFPQHSKFKHILEEMNFQKVEKHNIVRTFQNQWYQQLISNTSHKYF